MISFEDLQTYCEGKCFKLSPHAEKIYEAIKRRNGCCPCRVEEVMCPCPDHLDELLENDKCTCNLFVSSYYDPYPKFSRRYPDLFDIGGYFISFGFDKGWESIVDKAMSKLDKLDHPVKIIQVKEKFGGLRIYTDTFTDAANNIITDAEEEASQTCERCGSTKNVSAKGHWIKTYCDLCHKKMGR